MDGYRVRIPLDDYPLELDRQLRAEGIRVLGYSSDPGNAYVVVPYRQAQRARALIRQLQQRPGWLQRLWRGICRRY